MRVMLARPGPLMAAALLLLTMLAWLLLAHAPHSMAAAPGGAAAHTLHDHAHGLVRATHHWRAIDACTALLMWWTMSVAMMLPTAAPAILAHASAGARAGVAASRTLRHAGVFAFGYLLAWWSFGAAGAAVQWVLSDGLQMWRRPSGVSSVAAGVLLLVAGLYQFSDLKRHCLAHCRSPLARPDDHRPAARSGALRSGVRHGVHCLGCCWALMALMLLGGAMSISWMAALTLLMLAEKQLPAGRLLGCIAGVGLIGWGSLLVAAA